MSHSPSPRYGGIVQRKSTQYLNDQFYIMVEYIKREYKLEHWAPLLVIESSHRVAQWQAGFYAEYRTPYVIAVPDTTIEDGKGEFSITEYAAHADDPVIGGFASRNWQKVLAAYLAHELAHALHWTPNIKNKLKNKIDHSLLKDMKPHGKLWKAIYSDLRFEFVNHLSNRVVGF